VPGQEKGLRRQLSELGGELSRRARALGSNVHDPELLLLWVDDVTAVGRPHVLIPYATVGDLDVRVDEPVLASRGRDEPYVEDDTGGRGVPDAKYGVVGEPASIGGHLSVRRVRARVGG